jgi:prepilin-type N-terminal cleavage/methylation domain-containing protein
VIPLRKEQPSAEADENGFTLIELLVVMIIIGILASIAIPTFLHQRQNAIGSAQISDLRAVADEVEGFYVNNEQYPTAFSFDPVNHVVAMNAGLGTGTQRVTVGNDVSYRLKPVTFDDYCLITHNTKAAQDRFWIASAGGLQPLSVTGCPF